MTVFAFYLFAVCVLTGGLFTVLSRNPVHSVLWLILAFLSSAGLFVLLGAEFVAMLLIIVYVGAVAVLLKTAQPRFAQTHLAAARQGQHVAGQAVLLQSYAV